MASYRGDSVEQLVPGDIIAGRFRIVRLIGRGGMGEVYEAQDTPLHEAVALKTLRADLAGNEEVARRFQKEIELSRKVTHWNVCRVFETGEHQFVNREAPPLHYFTMELLRGETLSARIRQAQRMSRAEAFPIAVQLAEGLEAAHRAGIVHADFKSGNVILVPAPAGGVRAVITDFGLSRIDPTATVLDETRTMTVSGRIVGTLAYMSPEQISGGTVTTASDIYSFGVVLFEMATGKLPFDGRRVIHAAVQRASGERPTARSLDPSIDPQWDAAITRCLQNDPARRFHSAVELADWFRGGTWRAPRLYWTRRQWVRAGLSTGTVGAAGAFYWTWSRRPFQPRQAALERYTKGVAALHSMTYETARRELEQAVEADPGFALAHASLARAYDELDYTERAKESMLRAVTVAQESRRMTAADTRKLRALHLLVSRDYERALPLLQATERESAGHERAAASLELGWLAQQREKTDEAQAAYARALAAEPRYAAAKLRLGYILGRRGRAEDALKAFQEAESLYSGASDYEGVTETLLWRASLLNRLRRSDEAVPVIEKALAVARTLGSTSQQIRLQLLEGVAARNLGDPGRASDLAQHAVDDAIAQKMENLATNGLIDLGSSFFVRGELEPAERYFRRALDFAMHNKARRSEARAQASLGSLCEQSYRPDEAKQFLEPALAFYQQAGYRRELNQATFLLGSVYEQLGDYDKGVPLLRQALESAVQLGDRPTEAQARERLAILLREQGGWVESLAEFERAAGLLGSGSQSGDARLDMANLQWRLGRRAEAVRGFAGVEETLRRQPNPRLLSALYRRRAEMAYADGDLERGLALARQSDEIEGRLIEGLVAVRSKEAKGADQIASAIRKLDAAKLRGRAAAARLSAGEALAARGSHDEASKMIRDALAFFEPRRIWEALFRAYALAARASTPAPEAVAHAAQARAAITEMRKLWSAAPVESYLRRPDIRTITRAISL